MDASQQFAASWPRIGAANGGDLVVVWATPFATEVGGEGTERPVEELLGATLAPGGESFGEPGIVDPDIGAGVGASPDLSVNTTGQADIVYRVVENNSANKVPALRPGDVTEQVRVARYGGYRWTRIGVINRNSGVSMRAPTEANAPKIAINSSDNGVVAWQEPEITGVARIWARRIFGASLNYVMPVSAVSLRERPIGTEADAPAVGLTLTGQAVVAYRQAYAPGSPLAGPRIFLNSLSDGESGSGLEFAGATVADSSVPGGVAAKIGPPSVDIDEHREVRLLYDANGAPRVVKGDDNNLLSTVPLGPVFSGSEAPAASVMNPFGGGVSAWPSRTAAGVPAVAVREDFPSEAVQTALVGGGSGGPIDALDVGRSGLGDGLLAFQQGVTGNAAIVGAQVSGAAGRTAADGAEGLDQAVAGPDLLAAGAERERAGHLPRGARWTPARRRTRSDAPAGRPSPALQRDPPGATARDRQPGGRDVERAGRTADRRPSSERAGRTGGGHAGRGDPHHRAVGRRPLRHPGELRRRPDGRGQDALPPPVSEAGRVPARRPRARQARQRRRRPQAREGAMKTVREIVRGCAAPVALALALMAPGQAAADQFGSVALTSARLAGSGLPYQQVAEAADPVISADGRYVAFQGTFSGVAGVWRRDLETGQLESVAQGDATLPSISADGRYISFSTNERLVPGEDRNEGPDVYVRDMEAGCDGEHCPPCNEAEPEACPFTLASAVNLTSEGATYGASPADSLYAEPARLFGSIAGRSAISADGREVAFETTAASNLLGAGESTPPLEILVRDLDSQETTLVSSTYDDAGEADTGTPVPLASAGASEYGAVFPGGVATPPFIGGHEGLEGGMRWVGASLSADGSTVAWMGQNIVQQAKVLSGERNLNRPEYAEPLWRRIADGASSPTLRVTGGSDASAPACIASGEQLVGNESDPSAADPCAGPFGVNVQFGLWQLGRDADQVPQLSADGTQVAFVTDAHRVADGPVPFSREELSDDLYVADMAAGPTRNQDLRRVTQKEGTSSNETEETEKASIVNDYALSADGTQVAFTTLRTAFAVGPFSYVNAPPALPGMSELFDANLADGTITRVTHGFSGEDEPSEQPHGPVSPGQDPYGPKDGAFSPTFSADASLLSFSSTADNLIYGDGNLAADGFVAERVVFPVNRIVQTISPAPPNPHPTPAWRVGLTARARADGTIVLYADLPGAGTLAASARSRVRFVSAGGHARPSGRVVALTVATGRVAVKSVGEGLQPLTLRLAPTYRPLAGRAGGLAATVTATFVSRGHPTQRVRLIVTFRRRAAHAARHHAAGRAR